MLMQSRYGIDYQDTQGRRSTRLADWHLEHHSAAATIVLVVDFIVTYAVLPAVAFPDIAAVATGVEVTIKLQSSSATTTLILLMLQNTLSLLSSFHFRIKLIHILFL